MCKKQKKIASVFIGTGCNNIFQNIPDLQMGKNSCYAEHFHVPIMCHLMDFIRHISDLGNTKNIFRFFFYTMKVIEI